MNYTPKQFLGEKKYYVYTHELKGSIIYVGKGSRRRAFEFSRRSKLWSEVVGINVSSVKVSIVKWFDYEEDAYKYEGTLTKHFKSLGQCQANLSIGKKHSEKTKRLLSEKGRGKHNTMSGKEFSPEHKHKLSKSKTGEKNHIYGKTGAKHSSSKRAVALLPDGYKIEAPSRNELANIIMKEYGISASMINQMILTGKPFQARYKKHEKARGLIVKYV